MCIIAPSLLEADYKCLGEQLKTMEKSGAEYVHIDVMDGSFVPNLACGMKMIHGLKGVADLVFDVHLMVNEPVRSVKLVAEAGVGTVAAGVAKAGADVISVHYEACSNVAETLKEIKQCGIRAGIVLNPETSAEVLTEEIWKLADVIQVMTVHPGRDGQHFIEDTLDKIKDIRRRSTDTGEWKDIEVDGSINCGNIGKVIKAGANIIVSGKALFNGNLAENIANMKQQAAMEE